MPNQTTKPLVAMQVHGIGHVLPPGGRVAEA
jgi:hypothetical protein